MQITLFTDSLIYKDRSDNYFPVRDQFPKFISPLGKYVGELIICSRCGTYDGYITETDNLKIDNNTKFQPLPFYENTEQLYKNYFRILPETYRALKQIISESEAVILRVHHGFAWLITYLSRKLNKPLFIYWAGAPINEIVKHNYTTNSITDISARLISRFEHFLDHKIVNEARVNFFIHKEMAKKLGNPNNIHWVTPNLIESKDLVVAPKKRMGGPLHIIYAGRIVRQKGVFDLVKVCERIKEENINIFLSIAGRGPQLEELKKQISRKNLSNFIKVRGHMPFSDIIDLMEDSHCLVLPSYNEGIPKVMWEGWAKGLALIISDVGGVSQYVINQENGILIKPGDIDSLFQSFVNLYDNEKFRFKIAKDGLECARKFSMSSELEKMAQTILRTVSN